jgi:hypothetical protein
VILTRGWGGGGDGLLRVTITRVAVGLLAPAVPCVAAVPCAGAAGRASACPPLHPAIAQTPASALAASSVRLMMLTSRRRDGPHRALAVSFEAIRADEEDMKPVRGRPPHRVGLTESPRRRLHDPVTVAAAFFRGERAA